MSLAADKSALRQQLKDRRSVARAEAPRPGAELAIASQIQAAGSLPSDALVAVYMAIGDEIDALAVAAALGCRSIALPVMVGRSQPLTFRHWRHGEPLVTRAWGIREPAATAAEAATPRHLLVPLLGFDSAGNRLGYGGGYYDRTLAALRQHLGRAVFAIGLAFDAQRVDAIPTGAYDQRLDAVATPAALHLFRD